MRNPNQVENASSKKPPHFGCRCTIFWITSTFNGLGLWPSGLHKWPTIKTSRAPKIVFKPQRVRCASSSFDKIALQSAICSTTNFRHPLWSNALSFSPSSQPLIGRLSMNDMVVCGMKFSKNFVHTVHHMRHRICRSLWKCTHSYQSKRSLHRCKISALLC